MVKEARPSSAGGRRKGQVKAWEPERPSSADRMNATWGGKSLGPSVASLARAEMAAREKRGLKQEVLHQLALKGNASLSSGSKVGTSLGPSASSFSDEVRWKRAREASWAENLTSRGIPAYDAARDKHCKFSKSSAFKRSPYGRAAEAAAAKELKRLAKPSASKQRHPTRRNSDVNGFAMTAQAYGEAARREVVAMYNRAAKEVTRRELALDRVLDEFDKHKTEDLVDGEGRDFRPQIRLASRELRDRTLGAVEAVLDWRRAVEDLDDVRDDVSGAPPPFLWEGQNYLVRLASADDVEQLLLSVPKFGPGVGSDFGLETVPVKRNPLLLDVDVDGLAEEVDGDDLPADAPPGAAEERAASTMRRLERLRCRRVARAVTAEERATAAAALRDAIGGETPASSLAEQHTVDKTRLVLSESEQKRLRPPTVDPAELEALGHDSRPPLPVVATFTCLHLVLQPEVISTNGRGLPDVHRLRSRPLRHTLLRAPRKLTARLSAYDPGRCLPQEVLGLLWPVLTAERFTADEVRSHSTAAGAIFEWMQTLVVFQFTRAADDKIGKGPREDTNTHLRTNAAQFGNRLGVARGRAAGGAPEYANRPLSDESFGDDSAPETGIGSSNPFGDRSGRGAASVDDSRTKAPGDGEVRSMLSELCRDVAALKNEMLNVTSGGASGAHGYASKLTSFGTMVRAADAAGGQSGDGADDLQLRGPQTATARAADAHAESGALVTTLLFASRDFSLGDQVVELTIHAVYRDDHDSAEYKLGLVSPEYLLLQVADKATHFGWPARALPAVEVDRITGFAPSEIAALPGDDERRGALKPLLKILTAISTKLGTNKRGRKKRKGLLSAETDVDDLEVVEAVAKDEASGTLAGLAARGAGPAAGHKRWQQLAVPAVKDGVLERSERVINSVQLDLHVTAAPTARERENIDAHGLDPIEVMHLDAYDNELQLLLVHQPGLYERSRSRWAALNAVASWIVARLRFERRARQWHKATSESPDPQLKNRLLLDRAIPLPPSIAQPPPLPAPCVFTAMQEGDTLVVSLQAAGPVGEAQKETPYATVALHIDEARALAAPPRNAPRCDKHMGMLQSLRQRITVEWLKADALDFFAWRGDGDAPTSQGSAVLHVDRVVYQERRRNQAVRAKKPPRARVAGSGDDDGPKAPSFDLTRLIPEREMVALVGSELGESKRALFYPHYRGALAAILATKLKLVQKSDKALEPGVDVHHATAPGRRYDLETMLVHEKHVLPVGVNGSAKRHLIGSLKIDDSTTLDDARRLIALEFDEEDVPPHFRFVYRNAPCAKKQEKYRYAVECRPALVLAMRLGADLNERDDDSDEGGASKRRRRRKRGKKVKVRGGYDWENESDDERRAMRRELARMSSILESGGTESMVRGAFRGRDKGKKKEEFVDDDAAQPAFEPALADSTPPPLEMVAVPLETTASTKQESRLVTFNDDLFQFDITSADLLRLGSLHGRDWAIEAREEWAKVADVSDELVDRAFVDDAEERRQTGAEDLSLGYEDNCVPMLGTVLVIAEQYDFHTAAPKEPQKKKNKLPGEKAKEKKDGEKKGAASKKEEKKEDEESIVTIAEGTAITELPVYKMIPKALDMRPKWRVEFDEGRVKPLKDFHRSDLSATNFRVPLRYAHLERLVVDVRSRARQIHMQRIHYFELVNPDHLVDEVFHMLCQWYPHSDGVDGAKWAKFAREMTLVPNITDPVRAAQVDIAYKRQFKSSDGKIQKGGRLDPAGLKEALIEISFIRFPIWQDPEKEAKEERAKAEEEARKKAEEEDVEDAVEEPILHIEPKVEQHDDLSLEGALAGPEDASLVTEDEGVETAEGIHINTADALHHRQEEAVDPEWLRDDTLMHLLLEHVIMIPEVNKRAWREAKTLAMLDEGERQSAAIRIQALHRMRWQRADYLVHLHAIIRMEAYGAAAPLPQAWYRYCAISRDYRERVMAAKREHEERCRLRRLEQHEAYLVRKRATVFRRCKFVNGTLVFTRITRLDPSREMAVLDYGLKLEVYVPQTQETFTFRMSDLEVRLSIEAAIGVDGLSGDEILDSKNISTIADRLLVRVINQRPIVIFTRRGHSERGRQVLRRGKMVDGQVYVVSCFHSDDEIVFHAYNYKSCETLRTSITTKFVKEWLTKDEETKQNKARSERLAAIVEAKRVLRLQATGVDVEPEELEKSKKIVEEANIEAAKEAAKRPETPESPKRQLTTGKDDEAKADGGGDGDAAADGGDAGHHDDDKKKPRLEHPFFLPENLIKLLEWLMERLRVMEQAAMSLQGMWKMLQAMKRIRKMLRTNWEKRWDRDAGCWFYVNLRAETKSSTRLQCEPHDGRDVVWEKPRMLGALDLPDPPDEWRTMYDEFEELFYMNPYTGQTSWLSVDDAARALQKSYRAKAARDYGTPSFEDIVKALRMQREVEEKYEEHPDRLSSMVNFGLLLATQRFDVPGARKLYKAAMEVSPENPVLLRAYGIFLLAVLEAPRLVVFRKALDMFKNAELRDAGRERFKLAEESMFHWAVVAQRDNPLALLNYALVQQCLVRDLARAGATTARWRADGRRPAAPWRTSSSTRSSGCRAAPSTTTSRPSRSCATRRSPRSGPSGASGAATATRTSSGPAVFYFWLNPITKRASWSDPDWPLAYQQRIARSQLIGEKQGWEQYWDPRLDAEFYYNVMDQTLTCEDPVGGLGQTPPAQEYAAIAPDAHGAAPPRDPHLSAALSAQTTPNPPRGELARNEVEERQGRVGRGRTRGSSPRRGAAASQTLRSAAAMAAHSPAGRRSAGCAQAAPAARAADACRPRRSPGRVREREAHGRAVDVRLDGEEVVDPGPGRGREAHGRAPEGLAAVDALELGVGLDAVDREDPWRRARGGPRDGRSWNRGSSKKSTASGWSRSPRYWSSHQKASRTQPPLAPAGRPLPPSAADRIPKPTVSSKTASAAATRRGRTTAKPRGQRALEELGLCPAARRPTMDPAMREATVAVQTTRRGRSQEKQMTMEAKEKGFNNRAPLWERRIPVYDALRDPYCRMFQGPDAAAPQLRAGGEPGDDFAGGGAIPGAAGFSSVAAAFDFEHHAGTDPASELLVLKAILNREALLSRLEVLAEDLVRRAHRAWALREAPPPLDAPQRRVAVDLMSKLRDATLGVCEAIAHWRSASAALAAEVAREESGFAPESYETGGLEHAFLWHGRNYALKMAVSDMDFVGAIEPLAEALGVPSAKMRRNPLMLPRTLDERADGAGRALRRAAARPPAPATLKSSADAGWGPRKHELVTWFDEAQEQLKNLQTKAAFGDAGLAPKTQALLRAAASTKRRAKPKQLKPLKASVSTQPSVATADSGHPYIKEATSANYSLERSAPHAEPKPIKRKPRRGKKKGRATSRPPRRRRAGPGATPAALECARAARDFAETAAGHVLPSDLSVLADLDAPTEGLALIAAATLTLIDGGEGVPSDVRWPTFVALVDGDAAGTASKLRSLDPESVAAFKRRALHRFLDAANREARHWKALPSPPAVAAAKKLDGWRKKKKKAPAGGGAKAGVDLKRRHSARLAKDEILVTVLREDLGPDPGSTSSADSPWLVTIFKRKGGGFDQGGTRERNSQLQRLRSRPFSTRFEARAYHPGTSVECSLRVADEEAPRGCDLRTWATDGLPFALDMYRRGGSELPRLRLGPPGATGKGKKTKGGARGAKRGSAGGAYAEASDADHVERAIAAISAGKDDVRGLLALLPQELLDYLESDAFEEECWARYDALDADGNGTLSADELIPVVAELAGARDELSVSVARCETLVRTFDRGDKGAVDRAEFATLCRYVITGDVEAIFDKLPEGLRAELTSDAFRRKSLELFEALDADGDGVLQSSELPPLVAELSGTHASAITADQCAELTKLYATGEGGIDRADFVNFAAYARIVAYLESLKDQLRDDDERRVESLLNMLRAGKENLDAVLDALPGDFAAYVTSNEFLDACMDRFDALDADGNGSLSPDELWPVVVDMSGANDLTNITLDMCERLSQLFDEDGDGTIDRGEFVLFRAAQESEIPNFKGSDLGHFPLVLFSQFVMAVDFLETEANRADDTEAVEDLLAKLKEGQRYLADVVDALPDQLTGYLTSDDFVDRCMADFDALDADGNGCLTPDELWPVIVNLAQTPDDVNITMDQCEDLSRTFDANGDGVIDRGEFVAFSQFVMAMDYLENEANAAEDTMRIEDLLAKLREGQKYLGEVVASLPDQLTEYLTGDDFIERCMAEFDALDADGNGCLTPDELWPLIVSLAQTPDDVNITMEHCEALSRTFDANGDGVIDRGEFVAFSQFVMAMNYLEDQRNAAAEDDDFRVDALLARLREGKEHLDEVIRAMPEDLVAYLTSTEFVNGCMARLGELDADGNGRLTPDELWPILVSLAGTRDEFSITMDHCETLGAYFDTDGDGSIDRGEFVAFSQFVMAMNYLEMEAAQRAQAEELRLRDARGFVAFVRERCADVPALLSDLPEALVGYLGSDQFAAEAAAKYDALDADGNGALTPDELAPLIVDLAANEASLRDVAVSLDECLEFADLFDGDGKGYVTRGEFVTLCQFSFGAAWLKGAEAARVEETLATLRANARRADELLPKLPAEVSAYLTSDAFRAKCDAEFGKLDADGNGALSPDELWPSIMELAGLRDDLVVEPEHCEDLARMFDADGNGVLDRREFCDFAIFVFAVKYLEQLKAQLDAALDGSSAVRMIDAGKPRNLYADKRRVSALLSTVETNLANIGSVIAELPADLVDFLYAPSFKEDAEAQFDALDADGAGFLKPDQLAPVIVALAQSRDDLAVEPHHCERLCANFATTKPGLVTKAEFIGMSQFILATTYLYVAESARVDGLLDSLKAGKGALETLIQTLPEDLMDRLSAQAFVEDCDLRFAALDADGNGTLDAKELLPLVVELTQAHHAVSVTPDHCEALVAIFDTDGNGVIDKKEEFVEFTQYVVIHAHATATRNDLAATFDDAAFDAAVDIVGTHDVVSSDE
ncbi:Ca2-binding protein [Aureococcus anophagefferens]|nr:Ca2-binding protein [Aureococcus anophagefferens]